MKIQDPRQTTTRDLSRQDAKNAKREIFLRTWRALRLCARHLFPGSLREIQAKSFKYRWLIFQFKIQNSKFKIQSGFTLVEVAIAVTLLTMMVLMLYGSFHLAERAATKAAARAEESQKLRTRQEFLAGYIRSAYPYRATPRDPSVYFSGAEGGLEFISSLSNGLGGRGMSKVRVAWEGAGALTLEEEMPARVSPPGSVSSQASEGGYRNRLVLAEDAGALRMEYLDSQSNVESWVGEWDGRQRKALPRAVRMTYRDERGEDVRWTFPIMMSALTP